MTAWAAATADIWIRCRHCAVLLYHKRLRRHLQVCPECGGHQRLTAPERIRQLVDHGSFIPLPESAVEADPVGFVDELPYPQRLAAARADTGLAEAVLCGEASIAGHPVLLAVMDFRFLGGSLGGAVGELITITAERALADRRPLLLVTASGGARMQEGVISLMQMATVSQAIAALHEAGVLTISLITDPTYGGVAASFATNTAVVLAECGARLGFAGPRVISQTMRVALPEGFQTAELLLRHGLLDMVVDRRQLRERLRPLLAAGSGRTTVAHPGPSAPTVLISEPERVRVRDPWRTVQLARDPGRPTTLDYLASSFDEFLELHGDRVGADCPAIVAGLARLGDRQLMVVGHQKGHRTRELLSRNFGMASPAGHRKAQRIMALAARLGLPVVTLIDTPGAHPGVEAEQQGQAVAIAASILTMTGLPVPIVAVITGEGGSGGALALAVADRVLVLANAVYSVISPEGCAAILWQDPTAAPRAAEALRLTAPDLLRLGVVDGIVPEPEQGAQADPARAALLLRAAIEEALTPLLMLPADRLVRQRRQRFRRFGGAGQAGGRPADQAAGPPAGPRQQPAEPSVRIPIESSVGSW